MPCYKLTKYSYSGVDRSRTMDTSECSTLNNTQILFIVVKTGITIGEIMEDYRVIIQKA